MTVHKHAEMIKAKADNVELITFVRSGVSDWIVSGQHPNFHPSNEYFLCLPQRKNECLHWLNGGEVEFLYSGSYHTITSKINWTSRHLFMGDMFDIRIKPKKEKRIIGVFKRGDRYMNTEYSYESIEELKDKAYSVDGFKNWQFIEIEIEV